MAEVGRISVVVEGKDVGLSKLISDIQQSMGNGAKSASDYAAAIEGITPAQQRAEAKTLQFAQSLARSQVAAGETSQAIYTLSTALDSVTPGTKAANSALTQLQNMLNRTTQEVESQEGGLEKYGESLGGIKEKLSGLSEGANGLFESFGSLGTIFGAGAIVEFGSKLIETGNELEKTQTTVRALAGSQENYNHIVELAKDRQSKFGGSLNDNLNALGSFANLAKRTGLQIDFLANSAARLAAIDPEQGLEGASVALKEFFSGDATSLAKRFELPKGDLKAIAQMTDATAQADAFDKVLTKLGASQQLLDSQANTTAVTYEKLKGNFADLVAVGGQGLASFFQPLAQYFADFAGQAAQFLPVLGSMGSTVQGFGNQILQSSTSFDAYNAKIAEVNAQLPFFASGITALTPAQYAFAQSMLQTGATATQVNTALAAHGEAIQSVATVIDATKGSYSGTAAEVNTFSQNLLYLASTSNDAAGYAINLANGVMDGSVSFENAASAVQVQVTALQQHAAASAEAAQAEADKKAALDAGTEATNAANQAIAEKIIAEQQATQTSQTLADMQQTLANLGSAVAGGMQTAAGAAAALAAQYGITTKAALELVNAQAKLAGGAGGGVGTGSTKGGVTGRQFGREMEDAGKVTYQDRAAAQEFVRHENYLADEKIKAAKAADAKAERELNKKPKAAKKAKGGGGGGPSKAAVAGGKLDNKIINSQEKLDETLLKLQTDTQKKLAENEIKHQQNILKINEDYNKKLAAQSKANELSKRTSKADFYDSLAQDSNSGVDVSKYTAEYEKAYAEAQKIAQAGNKKQSEEYLKLRTDQINQMKDLDKEEADVRNNDELSKGEKSNRINNIEGRRKLRQDAQDEELKQLQEGGDSINNEHDQQLADEQKAYQDNADSIISEAQRTADERIAASDRATQHIIENANREAAVTGKPLPGANSTLAQKQAATPKDTTAPATTGTATPVTATAPIPVTSSAPIPTAPTGVTVVTAAQVLQVQDAGMTSALSSFASMTEGKLNDVIAAVTNAGNNVVGKLATVEAALRGLRSGTGSGQTLISQGATT